MGLRQRNAVTAGHRRYALSLSRRTRADEHMQCPLGAGHVRSHTDTLSRERADTCVAALNVGRTACCSRGRPLAACAAWIAQSDVCAHERFLHARPRTRTLSRQQTSRSLQIARCLTGERKHVVDCTHTLSLAVAVRDRRPVSWRQAMAAHAACAQLQSMLHAAEHVNSPSQRGRCPPQRRKVRSELRLALLLVSLSLRRSSPRQTPSRCTLRSSNGICQRIRRSRSANSPRGLPTASAPLLGCPREVRREDGGRCVAGRRPPGVPP